MAKKTPTTTITFDEIKDGDKFEELVASYFRGLKSPSTIVLPPAKGVDGGRDIIVEFKMTDTIHEFTRKWVVQCKFWKASVGKGLLHKVNIPTLIHQYGAVGYLLVVKEQTATPLSTQFEELNKTCKFGYCYQIWNGAEFISKLYDRSDIQEHFFPDYYAYRLQLQLPTTENQ